jgi:hypothetical protein
MDKTQELREKIDEFYQSEYAHMTIKELLSGTTNIALPTMVQARAVLELKNWIDPRPFCHRIAVPKGAGKTVTVQHLTQPTYGSWTEGSALSAADPTVASVSVTIAPFGKVTQISDLLANVSAIDFVEEIGRVHGACVAQGIVDKVVDAMGAASGNVKSIGTKGDSTEADFTFANVSDAMGLVLADGFKPDHLITAPDKLWKCFATDWDMKMFYGALTDFVMSGEPPNVLGMKWLMDPYFELAINGGSAWNGTNGEKYAVIGSTGFACAWAELQPEPVVEIYRVPTELGSYVVTHLDGGAAKLIDNANAVIKHAA